jgi:hypothetical protein
VPGRRSSAALAGFAGVASIAVAIAALVVLPLWSFPDTDTTAPDLTTFVVDHRARLQAMMALYVVAVTLWLVFAVAAAAYLREAGAPPRAAGGPLACFAVGSVGFVTLLLAGFTAMDLLVYRASHARDPVLLYDLAFGLLAMSGMPTAVALGGFAAIVRRGRMLPQYTGWLAIVTALAHVLLLLSFVVPSGFFSLEGFGIVAIPGLLWLWIVATGVELLRRRHVTG